MKKLSSLNQSLLALGCITLLGVSSNAMAGAYQLAREYNAVEIGNSGAGGAAIANDASTAWANPAGLVRIHNPQLVGSADGILTYSKFTGSNTWRRAGLPFTYTQTGTAKSNDNVLVPALFYTMPLADLGVPSNRWNMGISVTAPFGLSTNYNNHSIVRYSSTLAKLQVIDISPNLAFNIDDHFSVGAGLDFDRMSVDIRQVVGLPVVSTALDATSKNTADGWGWGGHLGILYQLSEKTRFGLAYHSRVSANLTGNSILNGALLRTVFRVPSGQFSLNSFRTRFVLPPSTTLSVHHEFDSPWAVDGSVYYTQWSMIPGVLTAYNLAGVPVPPSTATVPTTVYIQQAYRNTWLLALGGSYQLSPAWLLRAGVNYDQSPIKNSQRNVIIPDSNRFGFSIGAHFQANKQISFDAGWMHLFFNDASVSAPLTVGAQTSTAVGNFNSSHVDILGLQMNIDFIC